MDLDSSSSTASATSYEGSFEQLPLEAHPLCLHFADFPDPVLIADLKGRIVFLNQSAEGLFGVKLREDGPLLARDILRLEGDSLDEDLVASCLTSVSLDQVPVRIRNPQQKWLRRFISANLVRGANGEAKGCLAIFRGYRTDSPDLAQFRERVDLLSSILKNFPIPFFTVNADLIITYVNDDFQVLTGFSSDEVVGKLRCGDVLSTPFCGTSGCMLKWAMQNKLPVSGARHSIVNRGGKVIPVVVYASIITDAEHNVIGGFEAIRDITPIIEAEQKIQLLTEMTQEGILMVDGDHRVIYGNSRMAEIYGRSKEDLLGMDARELLQAHHLELMADLMRKVDETQQVRFCSTIRPNNEIPNNLRNFETCMASVRVGNGIITCLYFRDLTSHIEAERELRMANSFLNNIIRSSVSGIIVVDTAGDVLIFNEGAERILGYKSEEVVGHSEALRRFYEPKIAREIMRRMRSSEYGPEGKLVTSQISFIRKDGRPVPVSLSASLIKEGDREVGSVGIFTDLSEQLKIRRELEEAKTQLLQSEKIASLGRLAAGVAHEINNPLAGILIYADLLMKDIGANFQWRQDLEEIIHQTLRCKQIVNRLLEFSRQPLGQRIPFDPNSVVHRCLDLLGHQTLFHDILFVKDLELSLPRIIGDSGQIQQVFTNLLINAATAMDGKGNITITSRFDPDLREVVLSFADSGPGVPEDIRDKIFEPFFTTKRPGEGTGLGLSVAYGIIQQHGGSIEVKDGPAGGALFKITLPLESPEAQGELIED